MKLIATLLLLAFSAVQSAAQVTFVRSASTFQAKGVIGTSISIPSPPDGIPAGHLLYAVAGAVGGDIGDIYSPSSAQFLPLIVQFPFGVSSYCSPKVLYVSTPIAGGQSFSVQVVGTPSAIAVQILEFSGVSLAGSGVEGVDAFDGVGRTGSGNGAPGDPSTDPIQTTFLSDLLIGTLVANDPVEFGIGLESGFSECGRVGTTGGANVSNVVIETQWRTVPPGTYAFSPPVQKVNRKSAFNWACFITAIPGN